MKIEKKISSPDEIYDEDLQNTTYWIFFGFILVWLFTIIVKIY